MKFAYTVIAYFQDGEKQSYAFEDFGNALLFLNEEHRNSLEIVYEKTTFSFVMKTEVINDMYFEILGTRFF